MNKKIKGLLSAFVSCIVSVTSMPVVLPVSDANAVTETTYQNVTIEQLKSVQNFILGNSEGITTTIDKTFDINNDDRIDVFDLCMLKKAYAEQIQKTGSFYSLSSDMVNENDSKYGTMIMSDEFHSKRVIAKADTGYDFSGFSPKKVINGPDNLYVLQFETVENAELCMNTLRKDKHIEYVELDEYMSCEEIETEQANSNSWGAEAIEADKYSEYLGNNYDSSVVVAVVDTGVAYHDFLKGRILNTGYDLVDNDPNPNDKHYHGTHVAGTVVDCTPDLNINIMPVRVLNEYGGGSTLNVGNGIRFAAENGADVINLSLGGHGCSKYIDDSIEYAVENGVTVVVAAGNNSNNTTYYCPAHIDNCIVVSACDSENNKANFSNYGNSVDVTAPGVDIRSCIPGGGFKSLNGTSMATPHISAAAAMIKYADENATPAEIEQTLKDISLDLGDPGKDVYYGYGLPKLSKLIKNDNPETPENPDVPIIDSGKCGDDVYYTLDENGLLTISGTGKMTNWTWSGNKPWEEYRQDIKNVIIEDGVTHIGNHAFFVDESLTSIKIPDSVTSIGISAFDGCDSLTAIDVSENNINYMSENGILFDKNKTTLIRYPECKKDTEYIIPDTVTIIEYRAFYDCVNLTSVTIPDSVTSIGKNAFSSCSNLTSVIIPDGVTSIEYCTFLFCSSLTSVTISDSVTSIGESAFQKCTSLASVTIPNSVTSIGKNAFYTCTSLTSITIPDSVTNIEEYAFRSCRKLESIEILNPDCEIADNKYNIDDGVTIYGYTGSTAQAYAEKYNRTFIALD
ncbi:MAG: leucine-rich repeat protein [Ruminococcus sp.]|nr:leucine-rich repeat protein [Ruminococcus sp.]